MRPEAGTSGTSGASGTDDELEGLEDDASLKAMRSVWLSMREEEPGAGGMAALMAAARAKAEAMRPASLWQRIGAALKRPPALAFATVLVLVGGAVVVSQQAKDQMPEPAASAPVATPAGNGAAPGAAREEAPAAAAPAADPVPAEPASPPAPIEQRTRGADHSVAKMKKPVKSEAKPPARKGAPAPALDEGGVTSSGAVMAPRGNAAADDDQAPADTKADFAKLRTAEPDAELEGLERKAREAAANGDCGTVEQLMRKIAGRDPQVSEQMRLRPEIRDCLARMKAPAPAER